MSKQLTKNFNSKEFDSPDLVGSGLMISITLVCMLQAMRNVYKKPIVVISGVRTKKRNTKVGGVLDSEHLVFDSADIEALTSQAMYSLVVLALKVGFTRIGINNKSIHLGVSITKPNNVIWTYY